MWGRHPTDALNQLNAIHYALEGAPTYLHGLLDLCDFFSNRPRRETRASFGGADPPPGRKKFYFMMCCLLVNFPTAAVFVATTRTSPRGVTPDRAQNKPFHGLRITAFALTAPENAPPSVGVIATGGTTRRPGVFREFFNGN